MNAAILYVSISSFFAYAGIEETVKHTTPAEREEESLFKYFIIFPEI